MHYGIHSFWSEMRKKQNPSLKEELLLKYRDMIFSISETCINESKCHISSEDAIRKIRQILDRTNGDEGVYSRHNKI